MLRNAFSQALSLIKLYFHILLGKLFGISYIIGYLRNPDPLISIKLLQKFGAIIDEGTTIKRSIYFDNVYTDQNSTGDFSNLKIGKNCYIGDCVFFDLANKIIIGNNVVISACTSFVTHADCNRSAHLDKLFPRTCEKIIINDGAWIALKAIILNGVIIGENSIVAAHSLVKNNVDKYCLYGGTPAKKLKVFG